MPSSHFAPDSDEAVGSRRDVFIVGSPRSGTTWLHAVLSTHPTFAAPPETHLFAELSPARARYSESDIGVFLPTVVPEQEFDQWCGDLWSNIRTNLLAARPGATRLLEKTPGHATQMDFIRSAVPGALFVHIVRDPVDVTRSLLEASEGWGSNWAPSSIEMASQLWNEQVGGALATSNPDDTIAVRYEDLLGGPAYWGTLLDFLSITPDWELPDLAQSPTQTAVITRYRPESDSYEITRDFPPPAGHSFHTRPPGRQRELSPFERRYVAWACRDLMTTFGYQPTRQALGPLDRLRIEFRFDGLKSNAHRARRALKQIRRP